MTRSSHRIWRTFAFAAALGSIIGTGANTARADEHGMVDVGGFLGLHTFNSNNELGAPEDTDFSVASQPKNFLVFGLRLGFNINSLITIEAEAGLIPTKSATTLAPNGAEAGSAASLKIFVYRAHILFHFMTGKIRPFALVGGGIMQLSSDNDAILYDDKDDVLHAGVGVKYAVTPQLDVRLDLRAVAPPSTASTGYTLESEILAGVSYGFGGKKAAPPPPPAPEDSDGDGIMDPDDKCPNEAEDADGFEDEDGCPDLDNDGDGIPDADDKCRDQPETKNGVDDEDGCPEEDPDGDGKFGSADKCPNEAEDADGFQDEDGCPDLDNDGDGVPDAIDKCPSEPETPNNYEDADGCPDEVPAAVAKFTGTIQGINFKTGSAVILRSSYRVLDQALAVLKQYPSVKLEIQGHTDDVGNDDFNLQLSQKRAESVRAYFVGKGIEEARLRAVGYGEQMPKDPRKTRAARAKNRRVEFVLINQ